MKEKKINCVYCGQRFAQRDKSAPVCSDCIMLAFDNSRIEHEYMIRCPFCLHLTNIYNDFYGLWEEGDHEVWCNECDEKFEISTHVDYTFTSPAQGETK